MVCCVVNGCKSNSDLDEQISFFQFPLKNPSLLNQWLIYVKRKNFIPKKNSKVCHKHFTPDSFEESSDNEFLRRVGLDDSLLKRSKRKLKENAIPTVFDFCGNEFPKKVRSTYKKRRKEMQINADVNQSENTLDQDQPSTSAPILNKHKQEAEEENLDNFGIQDNLKGQTHRRSGYFKSCWPQTNFKAEVQTKFMQNHSKYENEGMTLESIMPKEGVPSKLFEQTDPDWVPSKCLESIFSETFNEVEERKFESNLNMEDDQEEMPVIIAGETFMWEGKEMPVIIPGETPIPEENKIPSESLVTVKIEMPELTTSSESLISEENQMQFDSPSNNDFLQNTFNVCTLNKNSRGTQTDYYDLEIENRNLRIMISQLEENLKQLRMQKT